jgi:hypothetical protein
MDLWPNAVKYVTERSKSSRITKEHVALFGCTNILIGILMACGDVSVFYTSNFNLPNFSCTRH